MGRYGTILAGERVFLGGPELTRSPECEELALVLQKVVCPVGLVPSELAKSLELLTALLELECVKARMQEAGAEDAARAVASVVKDAVTRLDDGATRTAADLLMGVSRTRGLPRKDRRRDAADALLVGEAHFRKRRELPVLREVAEEICAMEAHSREGPSSLHPSPLQMKEEASAGQRDVSGPGSPRPHRPGSVIVISALAGVAVVVLGLLLWQRTHALPPVDDVVVTLQLHIDPPDPRIGDPVTATFGVHRWETGPGTGPSAVVRIEAGGRLDVGGKACQPGNQSKAWDEGTLADFPSRRTQTLAPGGAFTYREVRTFDQPGRYFAEPVKQTGDGKWGGIPEANRVCFSVRSR